MLYHAAAYKHVPLMESNPLAVVLNNTLGTYRLAQAAARNHIRHILMVSTDKAARPTSIMGVSKRMAEQALLACATPSTRVSCLRLGNVLASEGSVVGVFLDQIARGENITVTHPDADRYFFTMEEAVSLILESASRPRARADIHPQNRCGDEDCRPRQFLDPAEKQLSPRASPGVHWLAAGRKIA